MDIYAKLSQEFTTDEQKLFLNNFRNYLNYDQDKDHVIDFEKIFNFIGFKQKVHAKRLLLKFFNENEDFIINKMLSPQGERDSINIIPQHGGQNKEKILLTPNAFKDFCMKANTEAAQRVRKYYIKMENILFKHLNEILTETQNQLKTANDKIKMLENRKPKKHYELGDSVYIVKDFTKDNIYKVGSTENLNTREYAYYSHNSSKNNCRIIYTKKCNNKNILEKSVHYKLREFVHDDRHDWFNTDFETIRKTIDELQVMLDGEELPHTIDNSIAQAQDSQNNQENHQENTIIPSNNNQIENESDTEEIDPPFNYNNASDFDKFIEECCIVTDKTVKTSWVDINCKYRIWARATSNDYKERLSAYLYNSGYKKSFIFDDETNCRYQAFVGISVIPPEPIKISENPTEIEQFIFDNFKSGITARVSSHNIYAKFIEYKNKDDPNYESLALNHRRALNKFFQKHFFGTIVHDGNRNRYGFYGVSLKGEVSELIGKRINLGNRKPIEQINPRTKEITNTYSSLTEACSKLGISVHNLSNAIKNKKEYNGFIYKKI
jgi:phage anti-repressor protein